MPTKLSPETVAMLRKTIGQPCLANSRELEAHLTAKGFQRKIFGRFNQKSSIDAASESDRGVTERLSNAFDASLTAARRLAGYAQSDRSLTPRNAAQRFLNPNRDDANWTPQYKVISFQKPVIQFWKEAEDEKHRFRKYNPGDGLATVLVRDTSLGIARERMPKTILELNSDDKLKTFEAIGQFGHGGSSALAFCESCLVISQPRFETIGNEFYWTLIFPEQEVEASKQSLVRKWFADDDELPLVASLDDFPDIAETMPGTSLWHFGYNRGGWIKPISGPEQTNPWGRLGRLFFSYPLPFEIYGEFARTDSKAGTGRRTIKGAYFRLLEKSDDRAIIEYRSSEKSENLMVEGVAYGQFSVFTFVLKERSAVRDYVDNRHPVIMTLNGQNHGEMTSTMIVDANLPELASSSIVEIRLDGLDDEALSEIISNSREAPKNTTFTRVLKERVVELLKDDDALQDIEKQRQEEKAKQSSADLNKKIARFLSSILSDALAMPSEESGGNAPGPGGGGGTPRPEVPANDPPKILEFISSRPLYVPEGSAFLAKFKSDARPPRYSFHGDSPRCFARLELTGPFSDRLSITGKSDINRRGYGSVSLTCTESSTEPITEAVVVGTLHVTMQSTDGRLLQASLEIGVRPKPEVSQRKRRQAIQPEIIFCAPESEDRDAIAQLISEDKVVPFGSFLDKYKNALGITEIECAYWGEGSEREGISRLTIEINAAHPQLKRLFEACRTAEERIEAKERYVRDVVLDCYQHSFRLDDVPDMVHEQVMTDPDEGKRAAEICLNHDKALRIAISEREKNRDAKPATV
jgi:hypothetical protein